MRPPQGVASAGGAGGGGNASHVCSIPDAAGACEVYRLQYVAEHWGGFLLIVLVDGEQVSESPFRPFVFPPPTYPWFNSSSLQVPHPRPRRPRGRTTRQSR